MQQNDPDGCLHLNIVVFVNLGIALYILGSWRNNLEDWAAEDWNEDVGDLISLLFNPTFTLASDKQTGDFSFYKMW